MSGSTCEKHNVGLSPLVCQFEHVESFAVVSERSIQSRLLTREKIAIFDAGGRDLELLESAIATAKSGIRNA